jgi:hypothetical protein
MAEDELVAEAMRRSMDDSGDDDELKRAVEESLKHQTAEDTQLARALEESRQGFHDQQARLLAEYERARERIEPPEAATSRVNSASTAVSLNADARDVDAELAAALSASLLEPIPSIAEEQAALIDQYQWETARRKAMPEALHKTAVEEFTRPISQAEKFQLSFDYGGNRDASDAGRNRSTARWGGTSSSSFAARSSSGERLMPPDTDPALARRSTVQQSSIKKNEKVDGSWLRGERRRKRVVLDGQNVACAHGGGRSMFSVRGLKIALDFFRDRNVEAIAIVPQHRADDRAPPSRFVADNIPLLEHLRRERRVFFSPAGCHDDYFIIHYAMEQSSDSEGCLIVSNDQFREMPSLQADPENGRRVREFISKNRLPFMCTWRYAPRLRA